MHGSFLLVKCLLKMHINVSLKVIAVFHGHGLVFYMKEYCKFCKYVHVLDTCILLFNAEKVRGFVICHDCGKRRVIYSSCRFNQQQLRSVQILQDECCIPVAPHSPLVGRTRTSSSSEKGLIALPTWKLSITVVCIFTSPKLYTCVHDMFILYLFLLIT